MCSRLREQLLTVPLVLLILRVSRVKKETTQDYTKKPHENEQIFGKGVTTAQRNQYRKTGDQKKKYKMWLF